MITTSLLLPLLLAAQDAQAPAAAAPAKWSQAELEALSAAIGADIEAQRGLKFQRPVAVKLTDKKGFFDYAMARMEKTQTKERVVRDESIAKLLGLVPSTLDLEKAMLAILEEQVGGFYDPSSDTFFLMETFTGGVAKVILAHELTHALDDQHYDIDGTLAKLGGESDAELAFQAVVEGSGTAAMNTWFASHAKEVSMNDLAKAQGMGADALKDAPPYLWKPLIAVYLQGAGFLAVAGKKQPEAVAVSFKTPPRSMEQILHPEKYWKEAKRDEPVRVRFDLSSVPAGWTVLGEDTLGEMMIGLVTTPRKDRKGLDPSNMLAILGLKYTTVESRGWGGDRALLLARGDDRMLYFASVWDSPKDAREFADGMRENELVPLFGAGAPRTAEAGWQAGMTPTSLKVVETQSPRGRGAVLVRIGSFADPKADAEAQSDAFAHPKWADEGDPMPVEAEEPAKDGDTKKDAK